MSRLQQAFGPHAPLYRVFPALLLYRTADGGVGCDVSSLPPWDIPTSLPAQQQQQLHGQRHQQ